jgi:peptide subunit release factor 1 (eRF1)
MEYQIETLTNELLKELLLEKHEHCISLYIPTHRKHPENQQDVIRFKNLLKELKESLQKKYSEVEVKQLLQPFNLLAQDIPFWNTTKDGLAIFSTGGTLKVIRLHIPVNELVIVAGRYHTKPLRHSLQSLDRFQILSLNLDRIQLFEGNRFAVAEIELNAEIPVTLAEALGEDLSEKRSTVASYGGTGGQSSTMHHGDGGRKDQIDNDTEKFFRIISIAIDEHYSKSSGLPLILAALPEHHNLFHRVNKNPSVQKDGILLDTKSIANTKLAEMAWETMQPIYLMKLNQVKEKFLQEKENSKGSDSLEEVARAVANGRVETLLLEQNRIISGKIIDAHSGSIEIGDLNNPEIGDLLDGIAELAAEKGAEVIVIPTENMPTLAGLAAIFRY